MTRRWLFVEDSVGTSDLLGPYSEEHEAANDAAHWTREFRRPFRVVLLIRLEDAVEACRDLNAKFRDGGNTVLAAGCTYCANAIEKIGKTDG